MEEKTVIKMLTGSELETLVPHDPRLRIEHLCIGYEETYSSYIEGVTTTLGNVSGGGSRTVRHHLYDFGLAVENISDISMSIQVVIVRTDKDGYLLENQSVGFDISPGEKRRIWTGLTVSNNGNFKEFKSYQVNHIGVGPTPPSGPVKFSEITSPKINICDMFGLEMYMKRGKRRGCLTLILIPVSFFPIWLLILLLCYMLGNTDMTLAITVPVYVIAVFVFLRKNYKNNLRNETKHKQSISH